MVATLLHAQERTLRVVPVATKPEAQRRVALVIGNAAYAESPLKNPVNDARAMAAALREAGFEVLSRENANLQQMDEAVREFGRRLERAHAGLFYYAGHGMQIKGRNFLIPVGSSFEHEDEVAYRSIDAGQVLDKMDSAKTQVNLMVLDACRNNPFHRTFRARRLGLAEMEAPPGTLIAFATAPGSVALDGDGKHGVYTKHLLKQMGEVGQPVEQFFKQVRIAVAEETRERQIPWESSSLRDEFQFRPRPTMSAPPAAATEAAIELAFWDAIKGSKRAEDYAAYLEQFPTGRFVVLARNRQRDLRQLQMPTLPVVPAVVATPKPPAPVRPPAPTGSVVQPAGTAAQPVTSTIRQPGEGIATPYATLLGAEFTAVSFSPDSASLAVVGRDGRLRVLNAASGAEQRGFNLGQPLGAVCVSPDGRYIAVATDSGEVRMIEGNNGREIWRRPLHRDRVTGLAFAPDGRYVLSASIRGDMELSAVANGATVQSMRQEGLPLINVAYSPDGRYVAVMMGEDRSNLVKVVEVGTGRQVLSVAAAAASFSVNGRYLLVASGGHTPTLFDISSGTELRHFARYPLPIFAGAYSTSGQLVATVDADGRGQLLDTRDGRTVSRVIGPRVTPRAATFSADAKRFAVIDGDGRVAVFRFEENL